MEKFDPEQQAFVEVLSNQRNYFCNESAGLQAQMIVLMQQHQAVVAELSALKKLPDNPAGEPAS